MNSCYKLVDDHIKELGLVDIDAHDIVDLVDGYIGLGYGKSSQQEKGKHSNNIIIIHFHQYCSK